MLFALCHSELHVFECNFAYTIILRRNMVVYDDFCNFLEAAAEENRNARGIHLALLNQMSVRSGNIRITTNIALIVYSGGRQRL